MIERLLPLSGLLMLLIFVGCDSSAERAEKRRGDNVLREYVATPLERSKDTAADVEARDASLEDAIADIDDASEGSESEDVSDE